MIRLRSRSTPCRHSAKRQHEMKGDINPRIAATRDFLDQMLGTFEEWIEGNLPDDDSLPEASRIRELLEQYREAALQRKIAISAAWVAGPPFTVLDELLNIRTDWMGRGDIVDEVGSALSALMNAITAFQESRRSKGRAS